MSWPQAKLEDVISFIRGVTFKPDDQVEPLSQGSTVVMRTKNVQVAGLDQGDLIAIPSSLVKRKEQALREGDILISSANSWELVGKASYVPRLDYQATAGGFISIVRAKKSVIDSRYLYHWIASPSSQHKIRNCGRQTTNISNLDVGRFKDLEIPLPPLPEQKRIAAILDKADAIRRKRQQAIQLADEFLRSVFLDMFGDIPARKSKYQFLGCRGYVSASSGKSSRDVFSEIPTEIPIYGGNGINGYATSSLYDEPVIVLGRVGQQCAITNLTSGPAWVTDNAIVVQVTDSGRYNPVYLAYAFMHSPIRDTVTRLDLPFINQSMILDAPIPLPPIELQNKFEKIREKTFQLIRGLTESAGETQSCFSALSQKAFSGEL